jgi:hypothetical protein
MLTWIFLLTAFEKSVTSISVAMAVLKLPRELLPMSDENKSSDPAQNDARTARLAKEIIDAAIQENRQWEYLCLCLIISLTPIGIGILLYGIMQNNTVTSISGTVIGALVWPALSRASRIWEANRKLRLLELPLSRATSAAQAASIIRDAFGDHSPKKKDK